MYTRWQKPVKLGWHKDWQIQTLRSAQWQGPKQQTHCSNGCVKTMSLHPAVQALAAQAAQRQPVTVLVSKTATAAKTATAPKLSSYQEFTQTALDLYEQLNRDYNLGNLVPIYRIRRELGDRLPRQQFNQWLLDIQSDDYVQLMGGDLPNATPDQLEDSVAIPGGGTRFYVKRL